MDSTPSIYSLFIANPFWDKIAYVEENFLQDHELKKSGATLEPDASQMKKLWKQAKDPLNETTGRSGGSGANVMIPLAMLGYNKCSILGRIGNNDKASQKVEEHIEKLGATSLLIKSKSLSTGKVICLITPDKERTMVTHLGATSELNAEDIIKDKLQGFNHWHIEGYAFYSDLVSKSLETASQNNVTISLNLPTDNVVKQLKSDFQKHILQFHYIFGNIEEIRALTDIDDNDNIEEAFAYFDIDQIVAVTDGANGCWVKAKGEKTAVHYETPKIDKDRIINKTGAGDIWAGMYLALALQGKSVEMCVEMANRAAGDWIQQTPGTHIDEKTWKIYQKMISMKSHL